ncbi:MAG: gamma-glutamyl-gamma-aminobutyrate hydrolase family protein [Pseudomonadota bacterium]
MRPVIGIATPARITPAWPFLALSVWLAGGWPKRLPPQQDRQEIPNIDGLIIGGGDDISADLYGGKAMVDTKIDPARDAAEKALIERARPRGMPILGICRGAQMLAVVSGGTLHADIYAQFDGATRLWTPLPAKDVTVHPHTALAGITGATCLRVNSLHHQSVDRMGQGMRAAAHDEVGIVQAIELCDEASNGVPVGAVDQPFMIGVQWHPEFLFYRRAHRRLFRALVTAAKRFHRDELQLAMAA